MISTSFLTNGQFVLAFCFGIAFWTSWQPEGQGSHVAVTTALQAALSPVLLVAQMHPSRFVSWKTGGMVHLQVDRIIKTQGKLCPSGEQISFEERSSSLSVQVGTGYSGLSWHRLEGISSFQLHISLWYLQVFFVVCTVQTHPTVSQSVSLRTLV